MGWLTEQELRVGIGCMRWSTERSRDPDRAHEVVRAAWDAGITVFDTARAYALDEGELGHNERLLAAALKDLPAPRRARIVTKGGMRRPEGRWEPDGRAAALRQDCEASLEALQGLAIDLYLLHAPDPRTPWPTAVRALGALVDAGLVARVGLSNVTRRQLDEALDHAPIAAVEVALGPFDLAALHGGVIARCVELGLPVLAHSPLGGPRRVASLSRDLALREVAAAHQTSEASVVIAALLALHPLVIPIVGARTAQTARAIAQAAQLRLAETELERVRTRVPGPEALRPKVAPAASDREVVLIMGLQGAGKTTAVADWVARGYVRLNRDERGGTLRGILRALDAALAEGTPRLVLDNTYVTRASRGEVIATAARHGVAVRCVFLDTPPAQAQVNVVLRMLAAHGRLLEPEELKAGKDPSTLAPVALFRMVRELEPPSLDEGFASVDVVPFHRPPPPDGARAGRFIAFDALFDEGFSPRATAVQALGTGSDCPRLVFAWAPDPPRERIAEAVRRLASDANVELTLAHCPHPAGPPRCWCRPPLPGLPVAFCQTARVDAARSVLVGTGPAHRTLAATLGAHYESAE